MKFKEAPIKTWRREWKDLRISVYIHVYIPEGLSEPAPPVPVIPPKPSAAKLARGLPASFDTCRNRK